MDKERAELLYQVYISHHPEGTLEDFNKRLDWVIEKEERAMIRLREGDPLMKLFSKDGGRR